MNYYLVGVKRVVSKTCDQLTYHSESSYQIGQIIQVPVGQQTTIGIVLTPTNKPAFETKSIICEVESKPLPPALFETLLWMRDYYLSPLASILQTALPANITKKRRISKSGFFAPKSNLIFHQPTHDQQQVINKILNSQPQTHLLYGVTGSGKTTVYLQLIKDTIAKRRSALIIIPEIALTTQLTQQFTAHFTNVIVFHSGLTESTRHQIWRKCLYNKSPLIIIGTRSGLFLPLSNLGIVIIDEAHEISSLKQEKTPKYSSTQVASVLAKKNHIHLILGSATPLLTDFWLYEQKKCSILSLPATAVSTIPPEVKLVDLRQKANFRHNFILSDQLISAIRISLQRKEQVLLFHNRRGSTSATICKHCGWLAECPHCHIPLSLHHDKFTLRCHTCNYECQIPTHCPSCGSAEIEHRGIGTKLIESELNRLFPEATIRRFDADTPADQSVANSYDQLRDGTIDILVGTQIIAKGLNLPKLTTVGIIQADTGLSLPDFSASERTFQLLCQVIGRVGRNQNRTQVIIQTYQPDQASIRYAMTQDYSGFYQYELALRKKYNYPPFCFILKLTIGYKTETTAIKHAQKLATELRNRFSSIEIIGPAPSFYEKRGQKFYWQLTIKSKKRAILQAIVTSLPANWQFDLDCHNLLS